MKKAIIFLSVWCLMGVYVSAQGTLQFNQVKIVSNNLETVPAGKVWKITALYGTTTVCKLIGPCYTALSPNSYGNVAQSGFELNGSLITSRTIWLRTDFYSNNTCTNDSRSFTTTGNNCTCNTMANDYPSDPNILPIWIPAGANIRSLGGTSFVSVIEFNIIP